MLFGCIVTNFKSTFDSPVCEFTAKTGKGGIVSRCRCNIFTIGNRSASSAFCFSASCIRKYFAFSSLKPIRAYYIACSQLIHCICLSRLRQLANACEYTRLRVIRSQSCKAKLKYRGSGLNAIKKVVAGRSSWALHKGLLL